jgi:hypothetical protein
MAEHLEVVVMGENGDKELIHALAIIAVVKTDKGTNLRIIETGDLSEEWWARLPSVMQKTLDKALQDRRQQYR